ncbi:TonB-dependent receptor [Sphingosinithalassobacter tenebrarum]|uniref:TonB-dependent receptor n=2 Tax=Stakelama tenebrarum TaxID=2711215 RepID=A0A6G6YBG7_9SPHN|nr:TonB-dependent receptor [Sphingosinithalassobacter tenebrarum]
MVMPGAAWAQDATADQDATTTEQTVEDEQLFETANEIVVTAQRRTELSRDVPISVTSIDSDQIATAGVTQLSDTTKLTPALRFDYQGAAAQPTIRGVGTAITTSGGGPNVGIYVDGFFQSNPYVADFDLLNVEGIQVLKGPQGTLFGRNTTGGAIIVTTAEPSFDPHGEARFSYGRFNEINGQAYATFGVTDNIAMDIEAQFSENDGFITDDLTGNDLAGKSHGWSVRAGLKFEVSPDVSVLLRYSHTTKDDPSPQLVNAYVDESGDAGFFDKVSAGGQAVYGASDSQGMPLIYYYAPAGTFTSEPGHVTLNGPVSFHTNSDTVQATVKADLGFADFTSYTQYRDDDTPWFGDLDATAVPLFNINVNIFDETFSQEFLLNSHPESRLQWTVGLNYFQTRDTWDVNASFGTPFADYGGSSTLSKSWAGFADLTYEVVPGQLFITAGARYSHDIVTDAYFKTNFGITSYTGPDGNPVSVGSLPPETKIPVDELTNDSLTPRVVVRYKPSESSSIYASYTRGYKAGILNVGGLSQQVVEPEEIDAFEVGYKYGDRSFSLDLSGYYYDYKNLQVSSYQNGAAQIRNAASSEIYGIEGQVRYRVSQAFSVNMGAAWTHARYKSFPNAPYYSYCDPAVATGDLACGAIGPGSLTQTTTDASGLQMQRAPEFTASAGASYTTMLAGGDLTLSGNLYYTSSFYFDPSEQFRQDAYEVLSLRAEWTDITDTFTISVFGDNVTDNRYRTQVLFNTLGIGSTWSAPVTYGVGLGVKF